MTTDYPRSNSVSHEGRSRARLAILGGLVLIVLTLGAWVVATAVTAEVDAVSVSALVVAFIALAFDVLTFIRGLRRQPEAAVGELADNLADVIENELQEEAIARRLRDPRILPLSWTETKRSVRDDPRSVIGDTRMPVRLKLTGRLDHNFDEATRRLAEDFAAVPSRRLVILGEPGAGKSVLALMLTLGILGNRAPGDPVPVLLPASSWDPLSQELDDWTITALADTYYDGDTSIPARLVRRMLVLPVVDGLDEIPESERRSAIRAINKTVRLDRPIVVTCRSVEYQDLIEGGAPTLRRAPVVEVLPVQLTDVKEYFGAVDWPENTSWDAVFRRLEESPELPVSKALSTPLMITFARAVFEKLDLSPSTLLDENRFDSRHAAEEFLTNRVIDAAYAPQAAANNDASGPTRWNAVDARRWLTFIARYMHRYHERDLAWWLLGQRLLSPWVAPALGIGSGALLMTSVCVWMIAFAPAQEVPLNETLLVGASVGIVFAVLSMTTWYAFVGRRPGRLLVARRGSIERLRRGFLTGLFAAALPIVPTLTVVVLVITVSNTWSVLTVEYYVSGLIACALGVLTVATSVAVNSWLDATSESAGRATPLASIRRDQRSSLIGSAAAGLTVAVLALPSVALGLLTGSLVSKLSSDWAGWPGQSDITDLTRARAHDIATFMVNPLLLIGGGALLPGFFVACLVFLTRAWPRFVLFRLIMFVRRRLPWNLPRFLADARDRGVLRQVGTVYQFRHIRLQESLADPAVVGSAITQVERRRSAGVVSRRWKVKLAGALVLLVAPVYISAVVPDDKARSSLAGQYGAGPYFVTESRDGRFLATRSASDSKVRVWDAVAGVLVSEYEFGIRAGYKIDFSPNSRVLVAQPWYVPIDSAEYSHIAWEAHTGKLLCGDCDNIYFLAGGRVVLLASRPDPRQNAVGNLSLWDTATRNTIRRFDRVSWTVPKNAEPDGDGESSTFLVSSSSGPSLLIDATTGATIADFADADDLWFSEDGRHIYGVDANGRMQLWSAMDGRLITVLDAVGPSSDLQLVPRGNRVAATAGGRLTGNDDDRVKIWDSGTGSLIAEHVSLDGFRELIFSEDGRRLVALTADAPTGDLWIVDPHDGRIVAVIPGVEDYEFAESEALLDSAPLGTYLITAEDTSYGSTLQIWDALSGEPVGAPIAGVGRGAASQVGHSEGYEIDPTASVIAVYMADKTIRLYGMSTGLVANISGEVLSSSFSPDGEVFAAELVGTIQLWETKTGQLRAEVPIPSGVVWLSRAPSESQYEFSPDGRTLVTRSPYGEVAHVWDVQTTRLLVELSGHSGPIETVTYSRDGRTIITSGSFDHTVRLWDAPR